MPLSGRRRSRRSEQLWKECGRDVQFRRLSNATWTFPTRCANDGILLHHRGDALEAVDDGGVIAAAERVADLDQLHAEQLAHQVHRDLARHGEILRARLGPKASVVTPHSFATACWIANGVERRTAAGAVPSAP